MQWPLAIPDFGFQDASLMHPGVWTSVPENWLSKVQRQATTVCISRLGLTVSTGVLRSPATPVRNARTPGN